MENFVVSARKYRPITFESVVGQSHITTTLRNAIKTNHLAQAFLFCGPRGVGKTTCARILAKTINCQNLSPNIEPCGACESCVSFTNNASFNIHELDAASNNSVEDIRNLIDQVRFPPTSGKYKIYIIDEVHMLSAAAFNAFLKTLEEPPSYAIFILATTEKHKILPTILSRCQNFDFNRISVMDMANHLAYIAEKEGITAESQTLELIAQKADGGLRDALSMFDLLVTFSANDTLLYAQAIENLHILDYDYYFKITQALFNGNAAESFIIFDEILKKGFDGHIFIVGLIEHFRNLLVCLDPITSSLLEVSASTQQKYIEQSKMASYSFLVSAMSIGSACDINYKTAKSQRLLVELALLKMANIANLFNPSSLPENEEAEKKNTNKLVNQPEKLETTKEIRTTGIAVESIKADDLDGPKTNNVEQVTVLNEPTKSDVTGEVKSITKNNKLRSTLLLTNSIEKSKVQETKKIVSTTQISPFSLDELNMAWKEFMAKLEAEERYSELVWLNRPIELEAFNVKLAMDNALQFDLINESIREELLQYLRAKLENSQIDLLLILAKEKETKKMIYTQAEKFEYLLNKNPSLLILKNTLGLDYDY